MNPPAVQWLQFVDLAMIETLKPKKLAIRVLSKPHEEENMAVDLSLRSLKKAGIVNPGIVLSLVVCIQLLLSGGVPHLALWQ